MSKLINNLKEKLLKISNVHGTISILSWDQQVNMPKKGSISRSMQMSTLSELSHNMFISEEIENLLNKLKEDKEYKNLNEEEKAIVNETYEDYIREAKLPSSFVKERSELISKASNVWIEAKEKSDFSLFAPYLKKIVDISRKYADIIGYEDTPYNALLYNYESDMTVKELKSLFSNLRDDTIKILNKINNSNVKTNQNILKKHYPYKAQWQFTEEILKQMGYDFDRGRQDISTHPFTVGNHPDDVRVTTRIDENFLNKAIFGSIHEGGHALYDQGLPVRHYGTPICHGASSGVHESQSRLWENIVGRSISFWKFFYPKLKNYFTKNLNNVSLDDFYKSINHIEPSLIRVEADELTYNLHIILRFEIETALIDGKYKTDDIPEIWNHKMKEYLGVIPEEDSNGALQDIHWSWGYFGYFPTYTLGNLYSAQIYSKIKQDIPSIEKGFENGDFSNLLKWLREKVHDKGKLYKPKELITKITGEKPSSEFFINYLNDKFSKIYQF